MCLAAKLNVLQFFDSLLLSRVFITRSRIIYVPTVQLRTLEPGAPILGLLRSTNALAHSHSFMLSDDLFGFPIQI